ncbi:MAG: ATP-binding cassette domain-containing protein [Elusimicrobiota bacterium]|nr:ATP-binding cassette domain-containing protein [Elusimicrobiota bacterium]
MLTVNNLKKYFPVERGVFRRVVDQVRAVDGISFHVRKGEVFALVGESGCGKTTTAKLIVGLLKPTDGKILFYRKDISLLRRRELAQKIQIIFQDPFASLNPRLTIGTIIGEAVKHRLETNDEKLKTREIGKEIKELLHRVGLPVNILNEYPHQFSGGQRQRIGIARALAMQPELIIADEPVSSLDISVQAQILNLLLDFRDSLGLSYLLIAHDLNVVRFLSDKVAVMYQGKIVEMGSVKNVYEDSRHPYTKSLLEAIPTLETKP